MDVAGVIIAAGYGTRFLPVTKTVPKELLPLVDRPAIDFIVSEMIDSGVSDILVITSRRKKAIEDYLDREQELENVFLREGRNDKLEAIRPAKASFFFRRQEEMKGTGHAISLARSFVGHRPFLVAYPDDICLSCTPLCKQLIDIYRKHGQSVLAVTDMANSDVSRFGVIDPVGSGPLYGVNKIVEKPAIGSEPSHLVSFGRFLFDPEIFTYLERGLKGHGTGEYYHVSAINDLAKTKGVQALDFDGQRLDTGTPLAYLESICTYALSRRDLAESTRTLIRKLAAMDTD